MSVRAASSTINVFTANNKIKDIYTNRLINILDLIMKEINYPKKIRVTYGAPIDPLLAYVDEKYKLYVCPLFVLELSEIPIEIRPQGWDDPCLCDMKYLQKLSDWIAEEFHISKQKVSFLEAAAAKTIIKLKQDPQGIKALRAGVVHELGHVALEHHSNRTKSFRKKEKEADLYAVENLHDGLDGIKIGFDAWQKSLQAVRASPGFSWKDRALKHLLITEKGNLVPLFFTHGSFKKRIEQAQAAQNVKVKTT